jgi:hypothetical protein
MLMMKARRCRSGMSGRKRKKKKSKLDGVKNSAVREVAGKTPKRPGATEKWAPAAKRGFLMPKKQDPG